MQVRLSDITGELLKQVEDVSAMDPEGHGRLVWQSQRLVQFSAPHVAGVTRKSVFVEVPSLSDEDLEPLYAKLEEVDPMRAKRLVRD